MNQTSPAHESLDPESSGIGPVLLGRYPPSIPFVTLPAVIYLHSNHSLRSFVVPMLFRKKETSGERDDEPCLVKGLFSVAHCRQTLKQKFQVGEN